MLPQGDRFHNHIKVDIKLQLSNKQNEAFLRLAMGANKTGTIRISRRNSIGRHISSFVRYSNLPVSQSSGTWLELPYTNIEGKDSYYLYFSVKDQHQINDYLDSMYIIFFQQMMVEGQRQKRKFRTVIDVFITMLNLQNDPTVFERLAKYDYRNRDYHRSLLAKGFHKLESQYF